VVHSFLASFSHQAGLFDFGREFQAARHMFDLTSLFDACGWMISTPGRCHKHLVLQLVYRPKCCKRRETENQPMREII